ncbi:MAG: 50S ribosomal protein L10 [Candidatus Micrarchaeota archaeon]|nr:50S ribosomal protein L10 [Candidatus Micrarchaeota archaeon]MCX8154318.1 50S ribosomal protein L10 [Candidatus Micrarchaeota archaeon]
MKRKEILKNQVDEILEISNKYPTLVLINLRKVPAQLQKNIRSKIPGFKKVVKKTVANRVLRNLGSKYSIDYPVMLILTDLTPYRVERILREETLPVAAKPGQIADRDIIIEETETNLPPGPSLSVLKQAGLDARVDKGKIKIAKTSTLVKAGQTITQTHVQALQLLGIKPFTIRASIAYAFDRSTEFYPQVFEIDSEKMYENILSNLSYGINLAVNSRYPNSSSIEMIVIGALNQAINLSTNSNYYSPMSIENIIYKNILMANNIKGDKQ